MNDDTGPSQRKRLAYFLRYLIALGLIAAILASIGFKEISLAWGEITLRQHLWTLGAAAGVVLIHTLRFHLLVAQHAPEGALFPFSRSLRAYVLGLGLGLVTPGRIGEVARIALFPGNKLAVLGAVLVERFCVLAALIIASAACAAWHLPRLLPITLAGGALLVLLAFCANRWAGHFASRGGWLGRLEPVLSAMKCYRFSQLGLSTSLALICLLLQGWQIFLLMGEPGEISYLSVATLFPFTIFLSLLPVSIGGLGLREGALLYLFSGYGIATERIIAASLLFYAVYAVPAGLVAAVLLIRLRRADAYVAARGPDS